MHDPRKSLAFHGLTTFVLQLCLCLALGIAVVYLIPNADIDVGQHSLTFSFGTTVFATPQIAFALSGMIAFLILAWRVWLLYLEPRFGR